MSKTTKLNINYGIIQALYYSALCAISGFASVYMLNAGISNSVIGLSLALANVFAFVIQPFIAAYLDQHKEIPISRAISLMVLAVIVASGLLFVFKSPMFVTVFQITIITIGLCLIPLINTLAFAFEKHGIELNFSIPRGIGSGAYASASLFLGWFTSRYNPSMLPLFYIIFTSAMLVSLQQFKLPKDKNAPVEEDAAVQETQHSEMSLGKFVMEYKMFMVVLAGCFLIYISHLVVNNFAFQIISNVGGNSGNMGIAVSIAAYVEIPVMFLFSKIKRRFSLNTLFIFSGVMFVIKTAVTWLAPSVGFIYFAQVLQMFAYAPFILCTVYYVNEAISPDDKVKGQSFMTMAMTLSGIVASLASGVLIDNVGVKMLLLYTTILTIGGMVIFVAGILANRSNLIYNKD